MYGSRLVVPQSGITLCLCMVHDLLYHNLEYRCVYVWFTSCCTTIWNIAVFMVWFTSCCTTIWNIAVFMYSSRLVVPQSESCCITIWNITVFMYGSRLVVPQSGISLCLCMVHVLLYHNLEYRCVYVWFTSCCTNLEYRCVYVWFTSCCTTIWNVAVFMYGSRLVVSQSGISLCLCMVHVLLYHNLEYRCVYV